jgi:hypothetical protein
MAILGWEECVPHTEFNNVASGNNCTGGRLFVFHSSMRRVVGSRVLGLVASAKLSRTCSKRRIAAALNTSRTAALRGKFGMVNGGIDEVRW